MGDNGGLASAVAEGGKIHRFVFLTSLLKFILTVFFSSDAEIFALSLVLSSLKKKKKKEIEKISFGNTLLVLLGNFKNFVLYALCAPEAYASASTHHLDNKISCLI